MLTSNLVSASRQLMAAIATATGFSPGYGNLSIASRMLRPRGNPPQRTEKMIFARPCEFKRFIEDRGCIKFARQSAN